MARLNEPVAQDSTLHWDQIQRFDSEEGNVAKFVFEKEMDGGDRPAVVEAVLYKYPTYEDRTVICCSSQSGCPVGCRFCGAGDYFVRSLSDVEIVDQVDHAVSQTGVDADDIQRFQVMFMSMGEPALNQKHLASAIDTLHEKYPNAKLLISSSAPDVPFKTIFEVSQRVDTVGLQFSVHESTDEARAKLIPTKTMSLAKIAETGQAWHEAIAFNLAPITRQERADSRKGDIMAGYDDKLQAFLDFVLNQYVQEGVGELDRDKLPHLLELKYQAVSDAAKQLGGITSIKDAFVGFQKHLYE